MHLPVGLRLGRIPSSLCLPMPNLRKEHSFLRPSLPKPLYSFGASPHLISTLFHIVICRCHKLVFSTMSPSLSQWVDLLATVSSCSCLKGSLSLYKPNNAFKVSTQHSNFFMGPKLNRGVKPSLNLKP